MSDKSMSFFAQFRDRAATGFGRVKDLFFRNSAAGARASSRAHSATSANRRELLAKLGVLPILGAAAHRASAQQSQEKPVVASPTTGTSVGEGPFNAAIHQYYVAKVIDLKDPETIAKQKLMPVGKIGNASIGRLICGSNLIGTNMHERDLSYVRDLSSRYTTKERIWMAMKKCQELGVNTFNLKANNFRQFDLPTYEKEYGGKIQWIADVIAGTDLAKFEPVLLDHLKWGPSAVYLWGGSTDQWYFNKQERNIVRAYEIMRKHDNGGKIAVGFCAHRIEPIAWIEKEGLKPDFYHLTLHHDRYWSAHPKENREPLEMFDPKFRNNIDHTRYRDNMYCIDAEKVVEVMQGVKVPFIAFKVMAAGAITPEDGFNYAFQNGADFICVGMFDWQVEQDAQLVISSVAAAKNRKRPWCA
jgi:hypothetical protein